MKNNYEILQIINYKIILMKVKLMKVKLIHFLFN